jgi:hypothetical protein
LEDLLALPIKNRQEWLAKAGQFITTQIQAAKHRLETKTHDIHTFFKPKQHVPPEDVSPISGTYTSK